MRENEKLMLVLPNTEKNAFANHLKPYQTDLPAEIWSGSNVDVIQMIFLKNMDHKQMNRSQKLSMIKG